MACLVHTIFWLFGVCGIRLTYDLTLNASDPTLAAPSSACHSAPMGIAFVKSDGSFKY
ncbi:hypothetical protein PF005_g5213 [Phytophthora fragariae]|uniref:Uncharacterized protein n=1 Tax=Phytophthora fragariae TaxID=53985 RepID=A0A6A3T888_9STRA|nr:hypothetical protein PF003_g10509 [Phytophthora fragariae]KAE8944702.1 hypothetical protein PF009_g5626 [Phytophthora fragariae]KAE9022960.1 hypothetical protein PF011_g4217 [Phytophthora fragariae]KAE9128071.1 hypothetical protein PF010_g4645 [Phytophthora fragariae]KAE9129258.1 hypothetical protein PF007_g4971 [Phytophthora fragariae]